MPKPVKSGYLPSLDGWRAVSIAGVLLTHDDPIHGFEHWQPLGGMGVFVFFAISGVLMAWRIQKDEQSLGFFDVKNFYLRRLFRIQPAAFVYLAILAVLMSTRVVPDWWRFWFGAALAFRNYQFHAITHLEELRASWFTGQFWSLAIEEHFYILLSVFFLFVKRNRIGVLGTGLAFLIVVQRWAERHGFFSPDVSARKTQWLIQYLLFPALLSLAVQTPNGMRWAVRYGRPWLVFALTAVVLLLKFYRQSGPHEAGVAEVIGRGHDVLCYCFGFWVIATMLHPESWSTRLLEVQPLRYLGRLSYSIYLWQQMFFTFIGNVHISWRPLAWASRQPVHYVVVLAIAAVSYHFVEKPLIRLGHRLAPPATPGHADLAAGTPAPGSMGVPA